MNRGIHPPSSVLPITPWTGRTIFHVDKIHTGRWGTDKRRQRIKAINLRESHEMPDEEAYQIEFYELLKHDRVHEGNWGAWLGGKEKLNSFTWIGNKNSGNKIRNKFNAEVVPNYQNVEKEDYKFDNYNFDHIFVCMSPQYIPPNHWHYFSMFISAFEEFTGKDAIIYTEKFETRSPLPGGMIPVLRLIQR